MASKLSSATLTIQIREDITLNGRKLGGINTQEIESVNEVSERILTVPTTRTKILALSSSAGAGTFVTADLKYIRLTNLDNANFVRLNFVSGSGGNANRYEVKLEADRSMVFTNASISGSSVGATFDAFSDFTDLFATADTAEVDVEMFVAST